jgi:nitrate reductase alpha subunit
MSDLEKISSELIVIAYQEKFERVKSLEKLEKEIPKMMVGFPEEQKKLIIQIIAELKQEASIDNVNSYDQITEKTPDVEIVPTTVEEKEIEVVEPITVIEPEIIEIESEKPIPEDDFSFLDDIDSEF